MLPQVPLPHLLAEGIGLLVESLVVLLATTLVVIALLQLEKRLYPYLESQRKRIRTGRSRMATSRGQLSSMRAEIKALTKTAEDVQHIQDNPPQVKAPTTPAERDALLQQRTELERLLEDAHNYEPRVKDLNSRIKVLAREHARFARQVRLGDLPLKWFAKSLRWGPLCLSIVGSLFAPPALAASFLSVGVVWTLSRNTEIRSLLLILYVIVAIGFIADRIINVSPLPQANVVTDAGAYRGTLVLMTESTWYLADPNQTVRSIPSSVVKIATFRPTPVGRVKPVADLSENAF
jgi:hypothetical protein